ncbi:MAG: HAMP domain-containing sensor histidine kinase [Parcubacteria group bacterium]|jgi:signal transduction histidine kinase
MINSIFCDGAATKYIFYSQDIPQYIYFIFLPSIIVTFLLGLFVFLKDRKNKSIRVFFVLTIAMTLWMVSMLGNWAQNDSRLSVFFDEFNIIVGIIPSIFIYFIIINFYKKTPSFLAKVAIFVPLLPLFFLLPNKMNVEYIDLAWCETTSGKIYWYVTSLLIIYTVLALYLLIKKIKQTSDINLKKQTLFVLLGFLIWTIVSVGMGIIAPRLGYPTSTLWAPVSCLLFTGLVTWSIIKYKFLNIKTITAQVLTIVIWILIGSQFFFIQNPTNRILNMIALALSVIFGIMLIKSIKEEVRRKEELQEITEKLAVANDELRRLDNAKSEFISIASHQLRTPLTSIKGYVSLILEGTYGKIEPYIADPLNKIYTSNERLIQLVEEFLNVSRIESGRMEFMFEKCRIENIVKDLYDTFSVIANGKGLYLHLDLPQNPLPEIEIDKGKTREVISNLVDNALKYTKRGGVKVKVELLINRTWNVSHTGSSFETLRGNLVKISISDTGLGVPETERPYLFSKFSRGKDTSRLHVGGTGLGLYVGKNIIEAQHGRIYVESEGAGKGSKFIVELPIVQPKG